MRNIVVFIDGTGQDRNNQENEERTNVARLYDGCKGFEHQSVKYCTGVGTGRYEEFTGNAFGKGLEKRIIEGYRFLQQEVGIARSQNEQYRIFIFGFSRGAFAARWLAAVVDYSGIPAFGQSERHGVYNMWHNDYNGARRLKESGKYYDAKIEMIGVWDTVQATSTSDFGVRNLPNNVNSAYHAMALDEYRAKFDITRYHPDSRVVEVWFAGCHADIGGGYRDGFLTANTTLEWMIGYAVEHGLEVNVKNIQNYLDYNFQTTPVIHDEMEEKEPFSWSKLGSAAFWIKKVWKITNHIRGEDKHIRYVAIGDKIHPSVNSWMAEYNIAHNQSVADCQIWIGDGETMPA